MSTPPTISAFGTTPIKAVVFDLDGTLLDTAPDFIVVVNKLRQQEGLPAMDAERIRNTVSHGARALITLAFDLEEGEEGFEPLRQRLLDLYLDHLAVESALFDGIPQLLDYIRAQNIAWGIATNKPERFTTPLLKALEIEADCVICPDHVTHAKPHPESMHLAAQLLNCKTTEIIYVGDHARDIECGRQANCPTIAAAYGYIDENDDVEQWQATHRVDNAHQLLPIVKGYLELNTETST